MAALVVPPDGVRRLRENEMRDGAVSLGGLGKLDLGSETLVGRHWTVKKGVVSSG